MKAGGYMDMKNQINRARWMWAWARQGGSPFVRAHDLQDLRNEEDLARWRKTQFRLRNTPKSKRKVISFAAWRLRNARRRSTAC
jgi:ribonuclease D